MTPANDSVPSMARQEAVAQARRTAGLIAREPFKRRAWAEVGYFLVSSALAYVAVFTLGAVGAVGLALTIVLVGVAVIAGGLRAARAVGGWQRALARTILHVEIDAPGPVTPAPGIFGWLRSALLDTTAWRAVVYLIAKVPLTIMGIWFAFSIWIETFRLLLSPAFGGQAEISTGFGILGYLLGPTHVASTTAGFFGHLGLFAAGALLLFVAPWPMRLVVGLDRRLMALLLGPDAASSRVTTLEETRARTVDASAATLRRIERNLHDGTQAQLVALAMRLGQAKEKLDELSLTATAGDAVTSTDLDYARRLVGDAHRGAKEAITDLRDLARGIHPPALDTGLENALSTLAARSPVPTEVSVTVSGRPSQAVEAIVYFCAAELLANVAQHAHASRAALACAEHGPWLRIVVRDDGRGGAEIKRTGSSSSGLAGLVDRVAAIDGELSLASPAGGPTVVTIDLPTQDRAAT